MFINDSLHRCQQNKWLGGLAHYDLLEETGPSNDKTFTIRCSLADWTTDFSAKQKQRAKTGAARLMYQKLEEVLAKQEGKSGTWDFY